MANPLEELPRSRREALANGSKYYFTNEPCKNGHLAKRRTSTYGCLTCELQQQKEYRQSEAGRLIRKKLRDNPKEKARNDRARSERRTRTPEARLKKYLRFYLYQQIKRKGGSKSAKTEEILGCSWEDYMLWLQAHFEPGMTFANHGEWVVDHIKPICLFDHSRDSEVRDCWHFSNLRPLWEHENSEKGGRFVNVPAHALLPAAIKQELGRRRLEQIKAGAAP